MLVVNVIAGCIASIVLAFITYAYVHELRLLQAHQGTIDDISAIAHMISDILESTAGSGNNGQPVNNEKVMQAIAKSSFSGAWVTIYDTTDSGQVLLDGSRTIENGGGYQGSGGDTPGADQREALEAVLKAEKESNIPGVSTARRVGKAPNGALRTITLSSARPTPESNLLVVVQAV